MSKRKGFTLVEIMIVVAIIGLLAAIAVPAFLKARNSARRNACINNLRMVNDAKDQYALEYGGTEGMSYAWTNTELYIKDMAKCFCPAAAGANRVSSNSYSIQALGTDPTCDIMPTNADGGANHSLSYVPGT